MISLTRQRGETDGMFVARLLLVFGNNVNMIEQDDVAREIGQTIDDVIARIEILEERLGEQNHASLRA